MLLIHRKPHNEGLGVHDPRASWCHVRKCRKRESTININTLLMVLFLSTFQLFDNRERIGYKNTSFSMNTSSTLAFLQAWNTLVNRLVPNRTCYIATNDKLDTNADRSVAFAETHRVLMRMYWCYAIQHINLAWEAESIVTSIPTALNSLCSSGTNSS